MCDPVLGQDCCPGDSCGTTEGMVCNSGKCECDLGFTDCDAQMDNGCEASLLSDPKNCGACGHDCAGGACIAGVCQPALLIPSGQKDGQVDAGAWVPGYKQGAFDFMPFDDAGFVLPVFVPATGTTQLRAFDANGVAGKILTSEASGAPVRLGPWLTPSGVFWQNSGSLVLSRVARAGGQVSDPAQFPLGLEEVHVDSGALYLRSGGLFQRIPSGSLVPVTVYASQPTFASFAVSGDAMFFLEESKLVEGSITGATPQTRYAAFVPPGCIASLLADANAVYAYGACSGSKAGWIGRYDRGTSTFVELLSGDSSIKEITHMVVDGASLYMVDNGGPHRLLTMPSSGGTVKVLSQEGPFYGLGQQTKFLYSWRAGAPNPGFLRVVKP